jgi:regulator of protease activity HflC (stomatin/prohibitin superfamily)
MAMAANLEAMGQQDEALATYQQIASANAGSFNAPMALIEQVHILQEKNRIDDARRICETIMTQYRDSYAAMEASQLLRTFLKSAKAQTPSVVTPSKLESPGSATVPPTIKVLPTAPPAPNSPSLPLAKPPPAPSAKP